MKKVQEKLWEAKEYGGVKFVFDSPNKKQAKEDAAMWGAELIREIKEYTVNNNGSISYK